MYILAKMIGKEDNESYLTSRKPHPGVGLSERMVSLTRSTIN